MQTAEFVFPGRELTFDVIVGVEGVRRRFTASTTGVTRLRITGERVQLLNVNDAAHLEAKPDLRSC